MKVIKFNMRMVEMPMKHPFTTSFGTVKDKRFIIIEAYDERGICGYGECDAFEQPWYTEETVETCWHMIHDFFIPYLMNKELHHPSVVRELLQVFRRNPMAKAGIETAIWDLYAKQIQQPLYKVIGGERNEVSVGVSIGLQPTTERLYEVIDQALANGAQRVKVKIKPGQDISLPLCGGNRLLPEPLQSGPPGFGGGYSGRIRRPEHPPPHVGQPWAGHPDRQVRPRRAF